MKKYSIKKVEKRLNKSLLALVVLFALIDTTLIGGIISSFIKRKHDNINTLKSIDFSVNYDAFEVYDRLNDAIINNKYLNEEEKNLIKSILWVFIDNKDYMDLNYFENALLTLKINYTKNNKHNNCLYTKAEYFDKKNTIVFYNSSCLQDVDDTILTHELMHIMQKKYDNNYNKYLIETINTIFNEEYSFTEEKSLYPNYYNFTKMLIEIIGEEPFRKYQCYTSVVPIVEELCKIYGSQDDAVELLYDLNEYQEMYSKIIKGKSKYVDKIDLLKGKILNKINKYYQNKYGFSMDNDLIMIYYYDKNTFYDLLINKLFINDKTIITDSYNIDYFCESDNNYISVYVSSPINVKNIIIGKNEIKISDKIINYDKIYQIDDSNRYLNNCSVLKKALY